MEKIDVKSLYDGMQSRGYICSPLFVTQVASGLNSKPTRGVMLHGPAGVGKSFLPEVLAEILDVKMFWHQVSPGTYETDLLLKLYPSEDTPSGMTIEQSTIYQAAIASQKERVLLVLDEWDKSRPSADGYFLDFFQSGRLPLPPQNGEKIQANLDNLLIMLTSNDERPFSEPFLRRFSKIDMEQLHPKLVKDALLSTHKDHKYLPNVLVLYCRALASKMEKPVTIQELRNLLDAIDYLGKYADWDTLVRQYITKTEENHHMLKNAENIDLEDFESYISVHKTKIDSKQYGNVPENLDVPTSDDENQLQLPSLVEQVEWKSDDNVQCFELEQVKSNGGIVENSEEMYSALAYLGEATDNPYNLTWIKQCTDSLAIEYPIDIESLLIRHDSKDGNQAGAFKHIVPMVGKIVGRKPANITKTIEQLSGEVMLTLSTCERGEFLRMSKFNRHIVKSMTTNEVITRRVFEEQSNGVKSKVEINFRWTKEIGLQIITPVSFIHRLQSELSTGRSSGACLLWASSESDSDWCPSRHTFVEQYNMPNVNTKLMRKYNDIAEFGVTRFHLRDGHIKSSRWANIVGAISKEKGFQMYQSSSIDIAKHEYFDTDWVKCDSVTVGGYDDTRDYHMLELRIHGNMSQKLIEVLCEELGVFPMYTFVDGTNARAIMKELSTGKGGWIPYPYVKSSLWNSKGIRFTAFGNRCCFWYLNDTDTSVQVNCTQLKRLRDKYSK
tara:strand:- start:7301 stop:9475 length:2175 start_codon:yes stop_codon:yes gene_type:complete